MTGKGAIGDSGRGPKASVRARLAEFTRWLAEVDAADLTDRERVDALAGLQSVAAAVGGAQAELTAAYADSQRALGCSARGIATEIGLARRVGLSRAMDLVRRSRILHDDLPETHSLMRAGDLDEHRGLLVADRVAVLDPAVRGLVDQTLADEATGCVTSLSDAELRAAVDRAVAGLDPEAVERRRAEALERRHVSVRSLPDGNADLTIRCSAVDAAAAFKTLASHADAVLAGVGGLGAIPEQPEGRSRDAIMADAALSWLTGHDGYEGPAVEVQLVLSAEAMLGGPDGRSFDTTPAHVVGIGPIPASAARAFIGRGSDRRHHPTDSGSRVGETAARGRRADREARRVTIRRAWTSHDGRRILGLERRRRILPPELRSAFTTERRPSAAGAPHPSAPGSAVTQPGAERDGPDPRLSRLRSALMRPPTSDELVVLTSEARCYSGGLRRFIELRDQVCRVSFCGAPIRHIDHVIPHRDRPETTAAGGVGSCAGHNLAKEDPGHTVTVTHDGLTADHSHAITWRTPTGREHTSTAPPVLGWGISTADGGEQTPAVTADEQTADDHLLPSPLETALARVLAA